MTSNARDGFDGFDAYPDDEIDRFATKLIAEFGGRTANYVAATIAIMRERGDIEGTDLWRQIYGAVGRLNACHGENRAASALTRGESVAAG